MTTRAAQIECLLTPVIDHRTNSVASGYTAYFYAAGTSTPKNVWTEKEKTNPYTSRTLGSDGTVQVYGDGVYKIDVKDTDGTSIWGSGKDNIKVQANTFTTQTKSDTYTATADDDLVLAGGTFTVNLATVTGFTHPIIIKRTSGTITIDPYSTETIDGSSTITLTNEDDSAVLYPDVVGGTWKRADRLSGLTATVAQLNAASTYVAGLTATYTELNQLDGNIAVKVISSDESASGVSTVTYTGLDSSKRYRLEFEIYWISGSTPLVGLRFGNSGGIDSGANYKYNHMYLTATDEIQEDATGQTYIKLSVDLLGDGDPFMGDINFSMAPNDATIAMVMGDVYAFGTNTPLMVQGGYDGASTIDRVQIMLSDTGTFSGRLRLIRTN